MLFHLEMNNQREEDTQTVNGFIGNQQKISTLNGSIDEEEKKLREGEKT